MDVRPDSGPPRPSRPRQAFNKGRNTTFVGKAAAAYDATVALLDAYRRAAPPKLGPDVLKELFNVKFQGKSGLISFDDAGEGLDDACQGLVGGGPSHPAHQRARESGCLEAVHALTGHGRWPSGRATGCVQSGGAPSFLSGPRLTKHCLPPTRPLQAT
jgi:hypothetical protein